MKIAILTEYYPSEADPASGVYVHTRAAAYRDARHEVRVFQVRSGGDPRGDIRDVAQPGDDRDVEERGGDARRLGGSDGGRSAGEGGGRSAGEDGGRGADEDGGRSGDEYDGVPVIAGDVEAAARALDRFRPDVIALHTPYPGTPHARVAESTDAPRVVWIHGYEAMITALHGYHRGLQRVTSVPHDLWKLVRLRRSLGSAAAVVYPSDWMRRTAERGLLLRHPRTRVIANPVDTDQFRPLSETRVHDAPASGCPRGLAFRPLRRVQGLDIAVAAYAGIDGTRLAIIGVGPEAERLRRRIERLGAQVVLEERRVAHDAVPGLMAAYDYFVSPSRNATQGVAMCEAMACGLPVVATRVGGIPEFVRDGVDGILASRNRPSALRAAVRELLAEPERRRAMGRQARRRIVRKCSVDVVVPRELALLEEAAA